MKAPFVSSFLARIVVLSAAAVLSIGVSIAKLQHPRPLLGLSHVFDIFVLALVWVAALWSIGLLKEGEPPTDRDRALENADWHLDTVRAANLPDERALIPGGVLVSWLLSRNLLEPAAVVGIDQSFLDAEGSTSVVELFEAFGGKLSTGAIRPEARAFVSRYLEAEEDGFFDDLERCFVGEPFSREPDAARLEQIFEIVDRRLEIFDPGRHSSGLDPV
jgi:hypothetical protein